MQSVVPRPIPPPPPQPSLEETRAGLRFLVKVLVVAVVSFLVWSTAYGPDSFFAQYGRSGTQSWAVRRAVNAADWRAEDHPSGGPVVWLLGSSMLREAFDQTAINARLRGEDSEWRVYKTAAGRGAPSLAAGLVQYLPVRAGDLCLVNIHPAQFRHRWLHAIDLPMWRVSQGMGPAEMWEIDEMALDERLEQAAAVPWNFWRWHEDTMAGLTAWWLGLVWYGGAPGVDRGHEHTRFSTKNRTFGWTPKTAVQLAWHGTYMKPGSLDLGPEQVNMQGIARMRAECAAAGAETAVVWLPQRQQYLAESLHQSVLDEFSVWANAQADFYVFPSQPDDDFYDLSHPNYRARAQLSHHLVDWLAQGRPRGALPTIDWPVPPWNRVGGPERPPKPEKSETEDGQEESL